MKGKIRMLLLLALLLAAACSSEIDFDKPPEIRYGEDVCERCSMIINEARFAAAYVTADGTVHRFDDIGGMLAHNKDASDDVAVFWVHDFETEEWLKADSATFVSSQGLQTPMGFGIIAFLEHGRAESWAVENEGMVMNFDQLLAEEGQSEHDHTAKHN